jgi:Fic family protein
VGIFRDNVLSHMAPPANQIPRLMRDLLAWLAHTDSHPLIASCVFHYELEFIHPFSDGNGRLGRLWQTLILSQWRPAMAYLPVESIIRDQQEAYYRVLGEADQASDNTVFIEFMLQALLAALQAGIETAIPTTVPGQMPVKMPGKTAEAILQALRLAPALTIPQLAEQTGSSTRTVERQLKLLQTKGLITRIGPKKSGHWQVN